MDSLADDFGFSSEQLAAMTDAAFNLVDAGDLEGAVTLFSGLTALLPGAASLHAALGSVLHEQGKLVQALAEYDTALDLDPKNAVALVNRGDLRCSQGDLLGLDDLRAAAEKPSPVQARAKRLLARFRR